MITDKRTPAASQPKGPVRSAPGQAAQPDSRLHQVIARRAYELYESAGRPDGQALTHWLRAEAEILGR